MRSSLSLINRYCDRELMFFACEEFKFPTGGLLFACLIRFWFPRLIHSGSTWTLSNAASVFFSRSKSFLNGLMCVFL